jgi:hypothetical protein
VAALAWTKERRVKDGCEREDSRFTADSEQDRGATVVTDAGQLCRLYQVMTRLAIKWKAGRIGHVK